MTVEPGVSQQNRSNDEKTVYNHGHHNIHIFKPLEQGKIQR